MGDRIVIGLTDGENHSPDFYGHWCGLRGLKVMNDLIKTTKGNGINNILCNFVLEVMERSPQYYSFYLYNHGEAEGAADWDNFSWEYNTETKLWTTTHPRAEKEIMTVDEVDDFIKANRVA